MRLSSLTHPRRVLMTLDAVGGVWSYALDTAAMLANEGIGCRLLGFGPPPETVPPLAAGVELIWTDEPLDWMVTDEQALGRTAATIMEHAAAWDADVVHLAAPSQAVGLAEGLVVVVQSHSCLPTWWAAMRNTRLPAEWDWQHDRNAAGFRRAGIVIAPSASHGRSLNRIYGRLPNLRVVPNATTPNAAEDMGKLPYVFAAGRWWDEGKNGRVLDRAAANLAWPVLMAGALEGPNGARLTLDHAIPVGQLSSAETHVHMARAAIFAAPSRYEPFGLAVLEAASRSAALVLADISIFRELWDEAAVFADPVDSAAWTAAIGSLAANPAYRTVLGERARHCAATFSFENQKVALLSAYDAALHHQPAVACV